MIRARTAAGVACSAVLVLGTAAPVSAESIPSPPPDLDCSDISQRNFDVSEGDPHNFDADGDGVGCEEFEDEEGPDEPVDLPVSPPPPDLDCSDVTSDNFEVSEGDPHNFDADDDGIGCETSEGGAGTDGEDDGTGDSGDGSDGTDGTDEEASGGDGTDQNGAADGDGMEETTEDTADGATPEGGVATGGGGSDNAANALLAGVGAAVLTAVAGAFGLARRPGRSG
ncbi:hypothetical protein FHX37_4584 [Haloactinospora alba]|uniref:Excalibur calcium-binding domain-containing protein n=1 Tax=Haloactinospora alba TaxID=405555 RepID=A0A543N7Q1_9ACTN|nr:hypothetical protein [Haloactinospora alba]TQN27853.1 hypothetical protein FHX37_4584 [Haloactinospora alba]